MAVTVEAPDGYMEAFFAEVISILVLLLPRERQKGMMLRFRSDQKREKRRVSLFVCVLYRVGRVRTRLF